jgi:DDE superfamily endonuclease
LPATTNASATLSLLAGIDLLTGKMPACVEDRHRSREFVSFLRRLDAAYPTDTAIKLILDNHSAHISKESKAGSPTNRRAGSPWCLRRNTETRLVAQSRGRLLLQDGAVFAPSHPRRIQGRTKRPNPCLP